MILSDIWRALRAGEELENSATWKNRQAAISAITAVLGLVVAILPKIGVKIELSHDDIVAVAGGIAALGGMLSTYFTAATSKRVGLPSQYDPEQDIKSNSVAGVGD